MNACNVKYNHRVPVSAAAGEYNKQCELLYNYLHDTLDIIHSKINSGEIVLVCCPSGVQQSATVILAYLMKYGKVDYSTASFYITSKCKNVFQPDMNFKNTIEMYQKYLNRL